MTLELRNFTRDDARDLWLWRNEEATRANSRDTAPVAWETHEQWCARSLTNPDRVIFIARIDGAKAGMVRFDRLGASRDYLVSIIVAPEQRGGGVGRALLSAGCEALLASRSPARLEAEIRNGNMASRRIFEACGFRKIETSGNDAFSAYERLFD
jgi:RimJ/RimL family protein N-acetyltransferase